MDIFVLLSYDNDMGYNEENVQLHGVFSTPEKGRDALVIQLKEAVEEWTQELANTDGSPAGEPWWEEFREPTVEDLYHIGVPSPLTDFKWAGTTYWIEKALLDDPRIVWLQRFDGYEPPKKEEEEEKTA